MDAFAYLSILLSFVLALALMHVVSRVGELVLARERVRFSGLQSLLVLIAVTQVFLSWLAIWDRRGVSEWDGPSVAILFAFTVGNYLVCVAAAPTVPADGPIELEAFYWRNRRLLWGLVTVLVAGELASNFLSMKTPTLLLFLETNLATLPFFLAGLLALTVSARWAQWTAGIGAIALSIRWTILSASLH